MALTQQWSMPVDFTAAKGNTASIPVVGATTDISGGIGPFTGQVIFCTADNMLYRYDGTSWIAFLATGGNTAATRHEARYEQKASAQSIATSTDTKLKFEAAITTSNDVTASGTGNTDFLLNRAGVWLVTASIRYLGATAGERHIFLSTGTVLATLANRFAGDTSGNVGNNPVSLSVASVLRVGAGTSVFAGAWQSNGSSVSIDVGFGDSNHISLTWLRPL